MNVSYKWLQSFFAHDLPPAREVASKLGFHSFELEGTEEIGGDTIIQLDVLANRGHDCLCHRGIAKEVAALCTLPLTEDPLKRDEPLTPESNTLDVAVDDGKACRRYAAAVIRGISVKESPEWLRERLEAIGQRPRNNIVDATNYVMFHMGQPLHAFDMEKLSGGAEGASIRVRFANEGEKITVLGGEEYALDQSIQLITDGESGAPIALAGIKGGRAAEVTGKTMDIVIESAHFDPVVTRRSSQKLKLATDASKRFENEITPFLAGPALLLAVETILDVAGGVLEGYVDVYPKQVERREISFSKHQTNSMLGTNISDAEIEDVLTRLSFAYHRSGETYTVIAPPERLDLTIPEDLIEEVGRLYGYENIPEQEPEAFTREGINKRFYYAERLRDILGRAGFVEVYTYSLRDTGDIRTENALASDKSYLRASLVPGLAEALIQNERNLPLFDADDVRLFEIGNVFPKEGEHTAASFGVSVPGKKGEERARAILEDVQRTLERELGTPLHAASHGSILEFDLDRLLASLPDPEDYDDLPIVPVAAYHPFSPYPFVLRDIAVWTPEGTEAEDVMQVIAQEVEKEEALGLSNMRLFDTFTKEGQTSYALRLAFQSEERTLTDEEVNGVMERVTEALNKRPGYAVR